MRVFQRTVDEGGFAAAARFLDMSPAVVTRLVADLEQHLGTRLLHRSTRRLSLTEAGETYLTRVRNILQDIDEADAATSSHTHELAGVLRLLAPPVLATHVLAPLVAGFRQLHPKIILDLDVETPRNPPIENYDLVLVGNGTQFDADTIVRKVIESDAILVASPAYLQRLGTPQVPQDLARHECLRLKPAEGQPRSWRMISEESPGETIELEVPAVLWANHSDTLIRATLDGAGITSAPLDLVAPYINSGELVRVLRTWTTGRLAMYAALPSRKFMPQRTRVFLDYLIEQAQKMSVTAMQACTAC